MVGATSVVRTQTRRRAAKETSAPRPQDIGASSPSVPDAEATNSAPMEWLHGGGTGTLIRAVQDIQADFRAEAAALQQVMKAFMKMRATVRVCFLLLAFYFWDLRRGRASAPAGCSPRVLVQLLTSRVGTS